MACRFVAIAAVTLISSAVEELRAVDRSRAWPLRKVFITVCCWLASRTGIC